MQLIETEYAPEYKCPRCGGGFDIDDLPWCNTDQSHDCPHCDSRLKIKVRMSRTVNVEGKYHE